MHITVDFKMELDTWSTPFLRLSKSLSKSTISEKNLLLHRRFVILYQQRCTPVHGGAESKLYSSWVVSSPVVSFQISDVGYGVSTRVIVPVESCVESSIGQGL